MKCLTVKVKTLEDGSIQCMSPGIQVSSNEEGKKFIFLGSKGKGCKPIKMYLHSENAPVADENSLIHAAYPTSEEDEVFDRKDKQMKTIKRKVLSKAYPSPTFVILRVNTSTRSTDRINGQCKPRNGTPKILKKGFGWSRGQRWDDYLYILDDTDALLVTPAGGGKNDRFVVRNDKGTVSCIPEIDYNELAEFEEPVCKIKPQIILNRTLQREVDESLRKEAEEIVASEKKAKSALENETTSNESHNFSEEDNAEKNTEIHVETDDPEKVIGA